MERGQLPSIPLDELNRVAAILGLQPSVRVYPGGIPVRDVASATRLGRFLELVKPPLSYRVEVALPSIQGRPELRAWDAVIYKRLERCTGELEMRLRDVQALRRRVDLKRRDDPSESFLLLVADTRHNRRVLAEFAELFADLPRLRPSRVRAALDAGQLPPTGLLLL